MVMATSRSSALPRSRTSRADRTAPAARRRRVEAAGRGRAAGDSRARRATARPSSPRSRAATRVSMRRAVASSVSPNRHAPHAGAGDEHDNAVATPRGTTAGASSPVVPAGGSEALVKQDTAKVNWSLMSACPRAEGRTEARRADHGGKLAAGRGAVHRGVDAQAAARRARCSAASSWWRCSWGPTSGSSSAAAPARSSRPCSTPCARSPPALVAFATAFLLVMFGGSALTFVVKAGTVSVLANAEAAAGPIDRAAAPPPRPAPRQRHRHRAVPGRLPALVGALRQARRLPAARLRRHGGRLFRTGARRAGLAWNSGILLGWTLATFTASSVVLVWLTSST